MPNAEGTVATGKWAPGWTDDDTLGRALVLYARACHPNCTKDLHDAAVSAVREADAALAAARAENERMREAMEEADGVDAARDWYEMQQIIRRALAAQEGTNGH